MEPVAEEDGVLLIKDVSVPWGLNPIALEGVGLVTGLDKTGSDPPPSPQRTALISDMQTYDVKNPNMVLSSPDTSLVLVRGFLPPGVQKGDRYDVEIRVPSKSETTSLRGGWLMRSRLREMAVLDNALHTGHVEGLAEGHVLIDSVFHGGEDKVGEVRGRVLGGGIASTARPIGLAIQSEQHSIRTSSQVGAAINARFHTYDRGMKRGVATPKRDNFVELEVHPQYKHNLVRYVRIIQNIPLGESATDRVRRLDQLERKLLEPATSATAALQLEALGKESVRILRKGLASGDPEVRFYAAEALAYLDDASAADALAETARESARLPLARHRRLVRHGSRERLRRLGPTVPCLQCRNAVRRVPRPVRSQPLGSGRPRQVVHRPVHLPHARYQRPAAGSPVAVASAGNRRVRAGRRIAAARPSCMRARRSCSKTPEEAGSKSHGSPPARKIGNSSARSSWTTSSARWSKSAAATTTLPNALLEAKRKEYLEPRVVVDALPRVNREMRRSDSSEPDDEPRRAKTRGKWPARCPTCSATACRETARTRTGTAAGKPAGRNPTWTRRRKTRKGSWKSGRNGSSSKTLLGGCA